MMKKKNISLVYNKDVTDVVVLFFLSLQITICLQKGRLNETISLVIDVFIFQRVEFFSRSKLKNGVSSCKKALY
jgi:hypothetical protein